MSNDTLRRVGPVLFLAAGLAAGPALTAPIDVFCTPDQIVVLTEAPRLQVRCEESFSGIVYFAAPTADPAQAGRILSVMQTALVAGRTLIVNYEPADLSGAVIGCQSNDCRLIRRIGFGK